MEALAWLERVFEQYGYLVLLIGLPVDFIALPLPPGQTTLAYTGYLIYKEALSPVAAVAAAFLGASIGVTATYTIGYQAGARLLEKFGRRLMIRPDVLEKSRGYYERYGNRFLFASFFIPGVRQFAGYAVGMLRVPFRTFAFYAYGGAACWTGAFIAIGYAFGEQWEAAFLLAERYLLFVCIAAGVVAAAYVAWALYKKRRKAG
ncbi:DedA family protein [Paenibacillus antri]|uniref:DedA family protein n=1 Tax=Paenibacillus antri TaxID=2582848 RepID=A0A5R9G6Q5_9BACL|nr:DedA family protein [Paenibacillus antri]